ncbi:MAG TPA: response regulator [Rhodanobacteraceae bacterium]|nr:response regulator [Rhodanobacteraceae bacterium]
MARATVIRILLAEDDPISLAFLRETLHGLGCEVRAVTHGDEALRTAREHDFDLLMLDHHLPGGDGDAVLHALRGDPHAASRDVLAAATTADPDPAIHAHLRGAGFARVLLKPLDATHLREAFIALGFAPACQSLDDDAGLAASGGVQALVALRGLFAKELGALAGELDALRDDGTALAERLHRLRASCGFCGAPTLRDAAALLAEALRNDDYQLITARTNVFRECLAETRAALNAASVQ